MNPRPRTIVSYFEHEDRRRGRAIPDFLPDLDEIVARNFNTVAFCVSEETLSRPTTLAFLERAIRQAKDAGLTCWADPWGIGKFFGGEGVSYLAERGETGCFCNPAFDEVLTAWVHVVAGLGVDGIYWDEPETKQNGCAEHDEADIIGRYSRLAAELKLYNSVCIPANYRRVPLLEQLAALPHVDDIAVDPYWPNVFIRVPEETRLEYVAYWAQQVKAAADRHGKDCHLWLQGFDIRAHDTGMTVEFARVMRQNGVHDLAFWGFRGCASLFDTTQRPELATPEAIWEASTRAFANVMPA